MQDLIDYLMTLEPFIRGSQYSVGGNWEDAAKIDLESPQDTEVIADVDESVAVEVFYELSDGRMVFLGLRYSDGLKLANSPAQFLQKVLAFAARLQSVSLSEAMKLLGELLDDNSNAYIAPPINYVELGVEGFWKSEGSLVLRKASEDKLNIEALSAQLEAHNHLARSDKNHTALEFAISKPESWIGVQVSRKDGDRYVTDLDSTLNLANLM